MVHLAAHLRAGSERKERIITAGAGARARPSHTVLEGTGESGSSRQPSMDSLSPWHPEKPHDPSLHSLRGPHPNSLGEYLRGIPVAVSRAEENRRTKHLLHGAGIPVGVRGDLSVCCGRHKRPRPGASMTDVDLSRSQRLEVQDRGAITLLASGENSSWLVDVCLPSVHPQREKEGSLVSLPLLGRPAVLSDWSPTLVVSWNPTASSKAPFNT